jgi:hypothetical protein
MGHDLFGIECGRLLLHVLAVIVSFLFVKKRYIILFFFSFVVLCIDHNQAADAAAVADILCIHFNNLKCILQ